MRPRLRARLLLALALAAGLGAGALAQRWSDRAALDDARARAAVLENIVRLLTTP